MADFRSLLFAMALGAGSVSVSGQVAAQAQGALLIVVVTEPVALGLIEAPGTVEGGDTHWLDRETLLVGHGYRTNAAGIEQLGTAFPDADVIVFDLPHWNGGAEVMHLMSLISPLDDDLALVYPRLAPVRLLQLLHERGIETVEVPDEDPAPMDTSES